MRPRRPRTLPSGAGRGVAVALVTIVGLGLVALASRPASPWGAASVDWPDAGNLSLPGRGVAIGLLAVAAGAGLAAIAILLAYARVKSGVPRRRRSIVSYAIYAAGAALALAFAVTGRNHYPRGDPSPLQIEQPQPRPKLIPPVHESGPSTVQWLAIGGFVAVTLALVVLAVIIRRRAAEPVLEEEPEVAPEEPVADDLDAVRRERDPRKAVIAAYAAMERTLAGRGLTRRPSEAPLEYLARAREPLGGAAPEARRLTDLFLRAKYGARAIDAAMKDAAVRDLVSLRAAVR
jgi:uncharacterized protein DUF4129